VGTALQRLYYMSSLAILIAERTNLPGLCPLFTSLPRAMRMSCGHVGGCRGDTLGWRDGQTLPPLLYSGGTEQFAWEQSFYGTMQVSAAARGAAVAEEGRTFKFASRPAGSAGPRGHPPGPRAVGREAHLAVLRDRDGQPWQGAEGEGGAFSPLNRRTFPTPQMSGYFYAFNALSLYQSFSAYGRATHDAGLRRRPRSARTWAQLAGLLPAVLVRDPAASTLADYGGDPNNYLE